MAIVRKVVLRFRATENSLGAERRAMVTLVDDDGRTKGYIHFTQLGREVESLSIDVAKAGTLHQLISPNNRATLENLTLTGSLNDEDYRLIVDMPKLRRLDLSNIKDVTIPRAAFEESRLREVILPLRLNAISERLFYRSRIETIDIPNSVRSIGSLAFAETGNLRGPIVMPRFLKVIGDRAFKSSSLNGVLVLNEGLERIEDSAFEAVKNLKGDLVIPSSVVAIGDNAFASAKISGDVSVGNGRTLILGKAVFLSFNSEGTLTMGPALTSIPEHSFYKSTIRIKNIGENVQTIDRYAFTGATFLKDLVVPDKVRSILLGAFDEVKVPTGLIVLGSSVSGIGSSFNDIEGVKKFWCKSVEPPTFMDNPYRTPFSRTKTLYLGVPKGMRYKYTRDNLWQKFSKIEEIEF